MRFFLVLLTLAAACVPAAAEPVPLSRPHPHIAVAPQAPRSFAEAVAGLDFDAAKVSSDPTPCDRRLEALATVTLLPRLIGPGACGGGDMVELIAVLTPDKRPIAVIPPAVLNCSMAESLASWLRDEAVADVAKLGGALSAIENFDSYECRTRNRIPGAKLSEHAHGEALDVRALRLADGRRLALTDVNVDAPLRQALRDAACHRFTTVLGSGEAYHFGHIHLDVLQRRAGYRICEWDVRTPPPATPVVPLPRPRPSEATVTSKH